MTGAKRNVVFWAVTFCLVFVAAFCIAGTVKSQSNIEMKELERYYLEKEQELVKDTREYLQQAGFANSGVMVTRVVEESGARNYTVTVHHAKINKMSDEDRKTLSDELLKLVFQSENCHFCHTFLMAD